MYIFKNGTIKLKQSLYFDPTVLRRVVTGLKSSKIFINVHNSNPRKIQQNMQRFLL